MHVQRKWLILGFACVVALFSLGVSDSSPSRLDSRVEIRPLGWSEKDQELMEKTVLSHPAVAAQLRRVRFRVLESWFGEEEALPEKERPGPIRIPTLSDRFEMILYDYSIDHTLKISGQLGAPDEIQVKDSTDEPAPPPTPDEYLEAYRIIKSDSYFGRPDVAKSYRPYEAMPGLLKVGGDLRPTHERVIAIGLSPKDRSFQHEIIGVSLSKARVIRYPQGAPPSTVVSASACGPEGSGRGSTRRGMPGAARIIVKSAAGEELWSFIAVRPSFSAGAAGSGVDLRDVFYRGKKVLSRLNTPILNVRYDDDVCGPYRGWQYSEHPFRVEGEEIASGILKARSKPKTIMDDGDDEGNFRGVAVWAEGDEVTLVSELAAGWYRYTSEYRFLADGSIQPRWGFAAVGDSCGCKPQRHHAYWRMDFDIQGETANIAQIFDGTNWVSVPREQMRYRDLSHQKWRLLNPRTGAGYEVIPGERDETAQSDYYSAGDIWLLRQNEAEMDDRGTRSSTRAALSSFVDDESIENQDVVLWYAGHSNPEERVGPTLRPVRW